MPDAASSQRNAPPLALPARPDPADGGPAGSLIETALGSFEMAWQRVFPGRADQSPRVRRFVRALLADTSWVDDVELIVSELAGNALRHTRSGAPGGRLLVEVRRGKEIQITVYDDGGGGVPRLPGRGEPGADGVNTDGESGRGLATVALLAGSVGCEGAPATGHAVWACLPLEDLDREPPDGSGDGAPDVRVRR